MKQEEIDILMEKINRKCKFPKHWNSFIEKQTLGHNYLIKDVENKTITCTHCNHTFYDSKYRIRDYKECPNCKNKFSVVSTRGYIADFTKSVVFLQRMEKQIIIRVFEILSFYNKEKKLMDRDIQEYCRIIPGKGKFLSDAVYFYLWNMRIYHYSDNNSWREYDGCRYFSEYPTYPYNAKRLIKGTDLEYAPIEEFCRRNWRYNFIDAVELAGYKSFELLWKMKLYNLCFQAKLLNKDGTFFKRFGVSKDHLKFMQDIDIDYRELQLLRVINIDNEEILKKFYNTNINNIKFLKKEGVLELIANSDEYWYDYNVRILKEIKKYIPLKKLNDYQKGFKNLALYRDYLQMADKLALNYKTNKDLFPRNLFARHDKLQARIKEEDTKKTLFGAYLRYLELSKFTYEDDKYIIFPAPSIEAMKDEGRQQDNCVGNMYVNKYINGETDIFFIRKKEDMCKSLITLEYNNGRIVQKELAHHNTNFTKEQLEFMDKWIQFREFMVQKEKYQIKVVKYKINSFAA